MYTFINAMCVKNKIALKMFYRFNTNFYREPCLRIKANITAYLSVFNSGNTL